MKHHPDYELFEELGRGQATIVYRGHDLTLGRDVAIKELNEEVIDLNPNRKAQFLKEAQFLAQFEHENILRVYSVEKQHNWIIMEMMQTTLATQVLNDGLDPDLVRSVLRQSLCALDFLHRKQKVHAAIRPSNLLTNEEGFVKLSDFEEADSQGELRIPDCGKKYLAPELLRPEFGKFGHAIDFYNLGFTALELLFGPRFDSLFPGVGQGAINSDIAWMRWHSSEEQLPPSKELGLDIPDDIAKVIDCLLVKQVDQRPKSAKHIVQLLEDRPLVRIEIKTTEEQMPSRTAYMASVREIGSRATKRVNGSLDDGEQKQSPRKNRQSTKAKPNASKLIEQIKRPVVLYALCAAMILAALFLIFPVGSSHAVVQQARRGEPEKKAQPDPASIPPVTGDSEPKPADVVDVETVTLYVKPAFANVQVDGRSVELEEGSIEFDVKQDQDVTVKVEHVDFGSIDKTISWSELTENYFLLSIELDPLPRGPALPAGLIAKEGTSFDPQTNLPEHAVSTELGEDAPMEFVLVTPTVLKLGANPEDSFPWETSVFVFEQERPFYIAITETTITQYSQFQQRIGASSSGTAWTAPAIQWGASFDEDETRSDLPATNMSQRQAELFARWVGGRLPTTNEWEVAVKFQTPSSAMAETDNREWQLFHGSRLEPRPVAEGRKTALGLINAMGNAAEWCSSESGEANVKGCSFANPPGVHIRPSWQSTEDSYGERYIGIRVLIPIETQTQHLQNDKG